MHSFDSFGDFYSVMTKYLGFKPMRHEGKILGLSAHGNPDKVKIKFPFKVINDKIKFTGSIKSGYDVWPSLKKQLKNIFKRRYIGLATIPYRNICC